MLFIAKDFSFKYHEGTWESMRIYENPDFIV